MADRLTQSKVTGSPPPQARLELRCWGEFRLVESSGRDVSPRSRKARGLVAWLAARPDAPVARQRLAGLLWGDRGHEQARASLRQCLHELHPLSNGDWALLSVTRINVRLNSSALASGCGSIAHVGKNDDLPELSALITAGEGMLFRDLDDLSADFDEWLRAERPRRRADLLDQALAAAEAGLATGNAADARRLISRLAEFDPLDDAVARLGMTADAEAGNVAAFERCFQRLREALAQELGVEPSAATKRLHRDLLEELSGSTPSSEDDLLTDSTAPRRTSLRR